VTAFLAPAPDASIRPESVDPEDLALTVVVAAYNAEGTLAAAVRSALAQSRPPAEVIVVDDGSSDGTGALAHRLAAEHPGAIRVLSLPHRGEAATKNAGAAAATTPLVAYLDADDVFLPEWVASVTDVFRARPDIALVTTDAWVVYDGLRRHRVYNATFPFEVDDQRSELLRRNFVLGLCAVRRAALLACGGFDEQVAVASDWSAWLRLLFGAAGSLACVSEPMAEYHHHPHSLSADSLRLLRGRVDVLSRAARTLDLTAPERRVLDDSMADQTRRLALADARSSLLSAAPGARCLSWRVVVAAGMSPRSRAKALAAAVLPMRWSRRLLDRSDARGGFRGAGSGGAAGGDAGG
jgi:Glycosyl transferase family 2